MKCVVQDICFLLLGREQFRHFFRAVISAIVLSYNTPLWMVTPQRLVCYSKLLCVRVPVHVCLCVDGGLVLLFGLQCHFAETKRLFCVISKHIFFFFFTIGGTQSNVKWFWEGHSWGQWQNDKKDILFKTDLTEPTFQAITYGSNTLNLIISASLAWWKWSRLLLYLMAVDYHCCQGSKYIFSHES